ncbi:hypothetical protein H0N99_00790 [Candidatus Micrarchaeota archaeon]|nr:hypothetical protein [Candidatus Micrarchaeota archaeon]
MDPQRLRIALFLLLIPLLSSAETVSLVLGRQYNFTANGSQYAVAMMGIAENSATFIVSGVLVNPSVGEIRILDLNGDGTSDVGITLDQIMPNSTVTLEITYNVTGRACRPINEQCSGFNDCCVGKCIAGVCGYLPTFNSSETLNASLAVPDNVTAGSIVKIRISGDGGNPSAGAAVDILTPFGARLTLTTNGSGEGSYLASEVGNYSYVAYGYLLSSNKTTISSKPPPPPAQAQNQTQPLCGDGTCNSGETCGTCSKDCGACVIVQKTPAAQSKTDGYSSLLWIGLMLLAIIIILRVILPIFVRE